MPLKMTLDFDRDSADEPTNLTVGQIVEFADIARANGLGPATPVKVITWDGTDFPVPTGFEIVVDTFDVARPKVIDAAGAAEFVEAIDAILSNDGDARNQLADLSRLRDQLL